MRYAPSQDSPAAKALTEALAHHEHQSEQLRHAVRAFTLNLRDSGMPLDQIITELRVLFGRSVHLQGRHREIGALHDMGIEGLMRLATEGFFSAPESGPSAS
jgi:hypothetical protein